MNLYIFGKKKLNFIFIQLKHIDSAVLGNFGHDFRNFSALGFDKFARHLKSIPLEKKLTIQSQSLYLKKLEIFYLF